MRLPLCCSVQHDAPVEIVFEGPLRENSTKERWWVVDGVAGTLSIYGNSGKSNVKGKPIHIACKDVTVKAGSDPLGFEVCMPQKKLSLMASCSEDRDKWMEAIERTSNGYACGLSKQMATRGLLHGKYAFVRQLGRGSSGIVRLYTYHGRPFAVKKFTRMANHTKHLRSPDTSQDKDRQASTMALELKDDSLTISFDVSEDVRREIAILKKVTSFPRVVTLHEVIIDEAEGEIFLVMEYLGGGPVMEWKAEAKRYVIPGQDNCLSEAMARKYFTDIIVGMQHLHLNNMCHRDLKPENLLNNESRTICKIADLGEAHAFTNDSESHLLTSTKGTYSFMAPEMLSGAPFCAFKADLWALGVTLYTFLYGELPFTSPLVLELFENIQKAELGFPSTVGSPNVRDVMIRLLNKDPLERMTLSELAAHPWLTGNANPKSSKPRPPPIQVQVLISENELKEAISPHSKSARRNALDSPHFKEPSLETILEKSLSYNPSPVDLDRILLPPYVTLKSIHQIAQQLHFIWCSTKTQNGWQYGKERNATTCTHPSLIPFRNLPQDIQNDNVNKVNDTMKTILFLQHTVTLNTHHCSSLPWDLTTVALPIELIVLAEVLAEEAHAIWSKRMITDGWTYGTQYETNCKKHSHLVPFVYISKAEQDKTIARMVLILKSMLHLGYRIQHRHHRHEKRRQLHALKK